MRKNIDRRRASAVLKADYSLLAAFRRELREFQHFSESVSMAAGVRPQQHQAMLVIRGFSRNDRMAVGELATHLKIKHHSAVGLVTRMQSKGLVFKAADPSDRRRVLVRLTARGGRALERLSAAHKGELVRVGPTLKQILSHLNIIS